MTIPSLPDGDYPFGTDVYPLGELAMHEAPAAISRLLIAQAVENGFEIARNAIVELTCRGGEMEGHRFVVYWPRDDVLHLLVPKRSIRGRA